MTIAYEDATIQFHPAAERTTARVPEGYRAMDDSDLDRCFGLLVQGQSVWVWTNHGIRHLHNHLRRRYRFVKAAGGVVRSTTGECLMIARNGRWDLPKGMVEPTAEGHETLRAAAEREVTEETGVTPLRTDRLIAKTYHIYDKYGGWHLKQTSWFAMEAERQPTHPQTEEDIAQAVWVPADTCRRRLEGSYASLRLLAEKMRDERQVT